MKRNTIILIAVLVVLTGAVTAIVVLKTKAAKNKEMATVDSLVQDTLIPDTVVAQPVADTAEALPEPEAIEESETAARNPAPEPEPEEVKPTATDPLGRALATGRPVLADFGRGTCIPCKKMAPILAELKTEYGARAEVLIIDIDEYMELTRSVGIRMIPTQIFYDAQGNEVTRHVGFMGKEEIITQFNSMGID